MTYTLLASKKVDGDIMAVAVSYRDSVKAMKASSQMSAAGWMVDLGVTLYGDHFDILKALEESGNG